MKALYILKLAGRFIWKHWFLMGEETPQTTSPLNPPSTPSPSSKTQQAQRGHIRVKQNAYRPMTASDVFTESDERHLRNGGVMEGRSTSTYVVTATGKIIKPSDAKMFCRVCGGAEDELLRSAVSHITLCGGCAEKFTKPDGEEVMVAPWELQTLADEYNTWVSHGVLPKEYRHEA